MLIEKTEAVADTNRRLAENPILTPVPKIGAENNKWCTNIYATDSSILVGSSWDKAFKVCLNCSKSPFSNTSRLEMTSLKSSIDFLEFSISFFYRR